MALVDMCLRCLAGMRRSRNRLIVVSVVRWTGGDVRSSVFERRGVAGETSRSSHEAVLTTPDQTIAANELPTPQRNESRPSHSPGIWRQATDSSPMPLPTGTVSYLLSTTMTSADSSLNGGRQISSSSGPYGNTSVTFCRGSAEVMSIRLWATGSPWMKPWRRGSPASTASRRRRACQDPAASGRCAQAHLLLKVRRCFALGMTTNTRVARQGQTLMA